MLLTCKRFAFAAGMILSLALIVGCGNKGSNLLPVRGKVTLDDKPLAKGSIATMPESGRGAHGAIVNGEFELGTFSNKDGALIGTHKVVIVATEGGGSGAESGPGKSLIPARYNSPDASGLTIDVKSGDPNTPTLKLTSQ